MEELNEAKGSLTWLSQFKGLLRYVLSCPDPAPKISPAPASFFTSTEETKTPEVEEVQNYYELISYEVIMFFGALVLSLALVFIVDCIIQTIVSLCSSNSFGGSLESTTTSPATSRPSSPPKLFNVDAKRIAMNEPVNCVYTRENKNKITDNTQSHSSTSVNSERNVSIGTPPLRARISLTNISPNLKRRSSRTQTSITGSTGSSSATSLSTAALSSDVKSRLRTNSTAASVTSQNAIGKSPKTSRTAREANSESEDEERMDGGRSPTGLGADLRDLNVVLTTYFENYGFNLKENKGLLTAEAPPTTPVLQMSCHEGSPIPEGGHQLNEYVWEKLGSVKEGRRLPSVGSISNLTYTGYDDDDARSSIGSWESDSEAKMKESVVAVHLKDIMAVVDGFSTPFESNSELEISGKENNLTQITQIDSPVEGMDKICFLADSTLSPEGELSALDFGLGESEDENIDMVIYAGFDSDGSIVGDEGSFIVEENQKVKVIWTGAKKNQKVSLTGSFLNWEKHITLERKGVNRHECTLELTPGTHKYRMFIEEEN